MRHPGVRSVEPFRQVAVRLRHGHATYRGALEAWPGYARMRRLLDRQHRDVPLPATGLLLSSQLGRMIGANPGDDVAVEVLEGDREQFTVRVAGWLDDYVGVGAYLRLNQLHRLLAEQDAVSGAWLGVDAPRREAVLAAAAALPAVAGVSSSARQVTAFEETFGRSLLIVAFVFLAIAGTLAFAMVFNAARTVFDERRRELATLRVIGMTRAETGYILMAELAVLALLSIPAGLALGYGLAALLAAAMQSELFRLPVILDAHSYARAALLLLAATAVSMGWSAWDLARLNVKEALAARD
jgi:putative ABC transport system permease protein